MPKAKSQSPKGLANQLGRSLAAFTLTDPIRDCPDAVLVEYKRRGKFVRLMVMIPLVFRDSKQDPGCVMELRMPIDDLAKMQKRRNAEAQRKEKANVSSNPNA